MMIYWIINLLISSSSTHFHLLLFCLNMWINKLRNDIESSIFLILSSNFHSLLLCFIVYLGITADKNVNPSSNCHNPKFIKGSWPANLTEIHHFRIFIAFRVSQPLPNVPTTKKDLFEDIVIVYVIAVASLSSVPRFL